MRSPAGLPQAVGASPPGQDAIGPARPAPAPHQQQRRRRRRQATGGMAIRPRSQAARAAEGSRAGVASRQVVADACGRSAVAAPAAAATPSLPHAAPRRCHDDAGPRSHRAATRHRPARHAGGYARRRPQGGRRCTRSASFDGHRPMPSAPSRRRCCAERLNVTAGQRQPTGDQVARRGAVQRRHQALIRQFDVGPPARTRRPQSNWADPEMRILLTTLPRNRACVPAPLLRIVVAERCGLLIMGARGIAIRATAAAAAPCAVRPHVLPPPRPSCARAPAPRHAELMSRSPRVCAHLSR